MWSSCAHLARVLCIPSCPSFSWAAPLSIWSIPTQSMVFAERFLGIEFSDQWSTASNGILGALKCLIGLRRLTVPYDFKSPYSNNLASAAPSLWSLEIMTIREATTSIPTRGLESGKQQKRARSIETSQLEILLTRQCIVKRTASPTCSITGKYQRPKVQHFTLSPVSFIFYPPVTSTSSSTQRSTPRLS